MSRCIGLLLIVVILSSAFAETDSSQNDWPAALAPLQMQLDQQRQVIWRLREDILQMRRQLDLPLIEPVAGGATLEQKLEQPVAVDLRNNTLSACLVFLQTTGSFKVEVDWPALAAAGVTPDTTVDAIAFQSPVPVGYVLTRLLTALPGGAGLAIVADQDVVRLSTVQAWAQQPVTRQMDATDLLSLGTDANAARAQLAPYIQHTITTPAPGSWKDGSIRIDGHWVTVTQSLPVLDQVQALLSQPRLLKQQAERIETLREQRIELVAQCRRTGKALANSPNTDPRTERLSASIPADFRANHFANVLEYLRNVGSVDIFVDWQALKEKGVRRETPITFASPHGLPWADVLEHTLAQAGRRRARLDWYVDPQNIVIVTTADRIDKQTDGYYTYPRDYDVLLVLPTDKRIDGALHDLAAKIQRHVQPATGSTMEQWDAKIIFGGDVPTGYLRIMQTHRMHRLIADYLDELRKAAVH